MENDWRFSGVLGQASREPRPDTRAWPAEDRLGKVVDVMERALANLNERITALENNSIRSGRDRSPELWPERKEEYIVVPERYSEHDKAPRGLAGQRSGQPFDDSYLQNNVTIVDPSTGIRDRRRDQPYPQNSMNEQFVRGSPYLYPPEIYARDNEIPVDGACSIPVSRKRPRDKGIARPPRAEDTRRTRSGEMKLDKFDGTTDVDTSWLNLKYVRDTMDGEKRSG